MSDSLQLYGLYSPWNSSGQNTGASSLSLLQGIFPTQGSNPGLLHCRQILYQVSYRVGCGGKGGQCPFFCKVEKTNLFICDITKLGRKQANVSCFLSWVISPWLEMTIFLTQLSSFIVNSVKGMPLPPSCFGEEEWDEREVAVYECSRFRHFYI